MHIRLLVLRTADMKALTHFYGLLGVSFDAHQHGNSPAHYIASVGKTVLEIYPLAKDQPEADKNLRLGIEVDDFEATITALLDNEIVFTEPANAGFGFMTIISDPDGRKVEVYKKGEGL